MSREAGFKIKKVYRVQGQDLTPTQISKRFGIAEATIFSRIRKGLRGENLIALPQAKYQTNLKKK